MGSRESHPELPQAAPGCFGIERRAAGGPAHPARPGAVIRGPQRRPVPPPWQRVPGGNFEVQPVEQRGGDRDEVRADSVPRKCRRALPELPTRGGPERDSPKPTARLAEAHSATRGDSERESRGQAGRAGAISAAASGP
ncbi:hypothetical protein GCM10023215_16050 [Pseudonocardia yuanmonensis]|uniref:Uncharacterized protein n=1 Tax=Pseudonocardia yuanmonensis TaxID=1095914 RepID=A0ABP8W7R2_9PSEU